MIGSLLIANRGEIACRIIRTARRLGVRTVAVYSDADAGALHVRSADAAVRIGPAAARESYLVGDAIIEAARHSGAEAIHPGYGFLSENAGFARAVAAAGLVWVGPPPAAIEAMGLKDAAKRLMAQAGVPVTPGYLGEDQSAQRLAAEAAAIGYPVLIKAVAGGGGKGMRLVEEPGAFAEALQSCRREAAAAFANDRVLIEKYIAAPRHIEVQVFGDTHGSIVHLFERDCSLQRRHQKVIEEAPAPGMDEGTRAALCEAAVRAARAVDYVGAGTVEFIADATGGLSADRIWFMEMNTRLQVEHPVTEAITGVDLVEWQLRIASGEPLPLAQDQLAIRGWAMEARLYAEDPARGFLPATGRLGPLSRLPAEDGVRIDSGVEAGDEVTPFYDPMIAKLIAAGPDREAARHALLRALDRTVTHPLPSNAAFLYRLIDHPDFAAARLGTGFIADHLADLVEAAEPEPGALCAAAALLAGVGQGEGPWHRLTGLRVNAPDRREARLSDGERVFVTSIGAAAAHPSLRPAGEGAVLWSARGESRILTFDRPRGSGAGSAGSGSILSPMPGRIIAVMVAPGDPVTRGQPLLTLEAMKMEHTLTAPFDGVVAELNAAPDQQVPVEALLARIEPPAAPGED